MKKFWIFVYLTVSTTILLFGIYIIKNSINFTLFSTSPVPPGYLKVIKVVDGDTIKVSDRGEIVTVRMLGIDTPEVASGITKKECFGPEASEFSKKLLNTKNVKLEPDSIQPDKDNFGRSLRYVYMEDGTFVNELLVLNGYAEVFEKYKTDKTSELLEIQEKAKSVPIGLWKICKNQ